MKPDLNAMTVPQLKELAKTAGIPKADGMKKAELVAALEKPIASSKDDAPPAPPEPAHAGSYREHMAQWPSKKEQTAARAKSSDDERALQSHPKFAKFKREVNHHDE